MPLHPVADRPKFVCFAGHYAIKRAALNCDRSKPHTAEVLDSGEVGAVIRWRKIGNEKKIQETIKMGNCKTVFPEIIFIKDG